MEKIGSERYEATREEILKHGLEMAINFLNFMIEHKGVEKEEIMKQITILEAHLNCR